MAVKDFWDLESALKVLVHPSVEAKLWAEAVEWLLINGPAEIRKILLDASQQAATQHFPDLKPSHYTVDGQPVYNVNDLAKALQVTEKNVLDVISDKESISDFALFPETDSTTVH